MADMKNPGPGRLDLAAHLPVRGLPLEERDELKLLYPKHVAEQLEYHPIASVQLHPTLRVVAAHILHANRPTGKVPTINTRPRGMQP